MTTPNPFPSLRTYWFRILLAVLVCCLPLYGTTAYGSAEHGKTEHGKAALFHFRNGFWINLHHHLYAQALATSETAKNRLRSSAEDAIQNAPCKAIPEAQRAAWQKAIDYYRTNYTAKDWLFDDDLRRLNDTMGNAADSDDPPAGLPAELREVLKPAASVYRTACWDDHRRANQAWIEALQERLEVHGRAIARRLTDVYEAKWTDAIVVDAVAYANWSGAYTYDQHITVASVNKDYQGDSALEMIFHESSHALDTKLFDELQAEFAAKHADMPRDLFHVVIFFTAGVLAQQELKKTDPDYTPYAYRLGIYKRVPEWGEDEAILQRTWLPYLEGAKPRKEAIQELAQGVCCKSTTQGGSHEQSRNFRDCTILHCEQCPRRPGVLS